MNPTTKLAGTAATGLTVARKFADNKMRAYADPAARQAAKEAAAIAAKRAAAEASRQMENVRHVVNEKVVPFAATTYDQAMVASEPARREALRRGKLAAAALRGAEGVVVVKKRRRWPVAMLFLGLGSAIGAAAAWLSQAGKPVEVTPYPMHANGADGSTDGAPVEAEGTQSED
jgi:hypothetical protein